MCLCGGDPTSEDEVVASLARRRQPVRARPTPYMINWTPWANCLRCFAAMPLLDPRMSVALAPPRWLVWRWEKMNHTTIDETTISKYIADTFTGVEATDA